MKYKDFLIFLFCLTPFLKLKRPIFTLNGSQAYFFDVPIREPHLTLLAEVWELIVGQKVSWKNMADSESQPSEKKKRRFLPAWLKEFTWLRYL